MSYISKTTFLTAFINCLGSATDTDTALWSTQGQRISSAEIFSEVKADES
jgi:hypothetical protein